MDPCKDLTGIEDTEICRALLESEGWDLEGAARDHLGMQTEPNNENDAPPPQQVPVLLALNAFGDFLTFKGVSHFCKSVETITFFDVAPKGPYVSYKKKKKLEVCFRLSNKFSLR